MGSVTTAMLASAGAQVFETGYGKRRSVKVKFSDYFVAAVDDTGVDGRIALKMFSLPAALLEVKAGLITGLKLETKGGNGTTTGIFAAFDGDVGVGTVAAASGATLATTEQNIVPTTATTQAVAGVSTTAKAVGTTNLGIVDATAGVQDIYLNILIDDADHDIAAASGCGLKISGEFEMNFEILGD